MNNCNLIGRITKDLELKKTQSNISLLDFTVAINNGKDENGNDLPADFIPCRAWRGRAETISKYMSKGSKIGISGPIKTQSWEDNNGNKHYMTYVLVDRFEFLDSKKQDNTPVNINANVNNNNNDFSNTESINISEDDLPFY